MRICHLILAILILALTGCKTTEDEDAEPSIKPRVSVDALERYLRLNLTRAGDVWEIAGQPENRQPVKGQEVWTYSWVHAEERTAYSGTRIGEERLIALDRYPGYRHILRRKTRATLVFDSDGILRDFRIVRE
jgi:hypothetical protein